MKGKIYCRYISVILTLILLAVVWEFWLEKALFSMGDSSYEPESLNERLEYIITVTIFCILSLIIPFAMSLKAETKRLKAEGALRDSRDKWEKTFDAIPDIITIQDPEMRIAQANKATCDFFNLPHEKIIGKRCYELFRGTFEPCLDCPELKTLQDNEIHFGTIHHRNLNKIFHVTSCPIMIDAENNTHNLVHIARDITDIKKLEEDFLQAQKMEAIGTLAGGIAHDFNNILSAIMGYSEIIKLDATKESNLRRDINEVLKAGERAKDLVKQILTFSRKTEYSLQPMLPHLVIKEAMKMLRSSIPTTIAIEEEIKTACGSILADSTQIHQITVNLCTNALHAMEDKKGTLSVSLDCKEVSSEGIHDSEVSQGTFVVLTVKDTGQGFDKKTIEKIFEPYFTTKERGKGTGLGLSVVHGIVKEYKGFIEVDSEPGKGSTFKVYIPALQKEPGLFVEKDQEALVPGGHESILVVDDEEVIANLIKALLEQLGYRVNVTTSSKEALEMFKATPDQFDLIITDLTMPDLSGTELAEEVFKIKPDISIIICTGYGSDYSKESIVANGDCRFLSKPVSRDDLAINVRTALDGE